MMPVTKAILLKSLQDRHIKVLTGAKVAEITEDSVRFSKDGAEQSIPAGTVVSAFGYRNLDQLSELAGKYCSDQWHILIPAHISGHSKIHLSSVL